MHRLLLVLGLLLCAIPAHGQSTVISGTITDQGSQAWAFGTVQLTFRPSNSNPTGQYFWNGAPFDKNTTIPATPLPLDGTGSFSGVSVPSNNFINPSGSTWTVQVCPAATTPCFSQNLTITGATANISAQIVPPAVNLNLTVPFLGARAYTDSEVFGALPGTLYFNLTDNRIHVCLQTGFPPCTWFPLNGGSVSSVSGLSPLFTVTNPTTTPTFVLSNAPATTVFGNPTGSPAAPGYFPLSSFGGVVTSVTGTTNQITASPTTGNVVLSFGVTEIMPGSLETNNSITTDNGDLVASGGRLLVSGNIISTGGSATIAATQSYAMSGRSRISSDADGNLTLTSNNFGTFNRLNFGPSGSSSFPALQRNNNNLDVELGDGSGRTGLRAANFTDDALTSGNCVQAGAAGILTTTSGPCPNLTGITQIQSISFCASGCTVTGTPCTVSSGASYDVCTNTITWPTTMGTAVYRNICGGKTTNAHASPGNGSTNFALTLLTQPDNQTATTFVAVTQNQRTNTAAFDEIDCTATR
jgi:hypothetical protein